MMVALTGLLAVTLAACGNGGDKQASKTKTTETKEQTTDIVFWHAMTGDLEKSLQTLTDEFNQDQKKYVVKLQSQGDYNTLQQKIMASAASGNLPAMAQTTYTSVPDMVNSKLVTPLDEFIKGKDGLSSEDLKDIYPGFLESSKFDNKYYSMPFSKSTRVLFYNKDILDKYHLEIPKTWEDVEKMGEVLKADNIYAMGFENDLSLEFETLARQFGADFIDTKNKTTDIGQSDAIKGMDVINGLLEKGYARTAGEDKYFSGPFVQGQSALYIGSSAGISFVKSTAPETLHWGTAELPTENNKKLTQFAGNDLVAFNSATQEQKAGAFAFMKFLMSDKTTAEWAMKSGYLPLRKSALELPEYKAYLAEHPELEAVNKELDYGYSTSTFVGYGKFRTQLLSSLDEIVSKKASVAETLKGLQKQTEEILNQAK